MELLEPPGAAHTLWCQHAYAISGSGTWMNASCPTNIIDNPQSIDSTVAFIWVSKINYQDRQQLSFSEANTQYRSKRKAWSIDCVRIYLPRYVTYKQTCMHACMYPSVRPLCWALGFFLSFSQRAQLHNPSHIHIIIPNSYTLGTFFLASALTLRLYSGLLLMYKL